MLPTLSEATRQKMLAQITKKEIKETVFSMEPSKAAGPDGFPILFYQKFWSIVSGQVEQLVIKFWRVELDMRSINHTNIALIPKVPNLEIPSDFVQ